jgi:TPR repeat protein
MFLRIGQFCIVPLFLCLAGCVASDKQLINAAEAAYPFEVVTYKLTDSTDPLTDSDTVVHQGDSYVVVPGHHHDDEFEAVAGWPIPMMKIRLHDLSNPYYMAQLSQNNRIIYVTVEIDDVAKKITLYDFDHSAKPLPTGFHECTEGICIDNLTDYIAQATNTIAAHEKPYLTYDIIITDLRTIWLVEALNAYKSKDYVTALIQFRVLAANGNVEAQTNLGNMYYIGTGVPQSDVTAAAWFRLAAYKGNPQAENTLGSMYEAGRGVPQDYYAAADYYQRAATHGSPLGLKNLANVKDKAPPIAAGDYRKAAERGDSAAQNALGRIFEQGDGVPQDYAEAAKWYRMAADQGLAPAEYNLASLYARGQGVVKDFSKAAKWYEAALVRGNAVALQKLNEIQPQLSEQSKTLSPSDLAESSVEWTDCANVGAPDRSIAACTKAISRSDETHTNQAIAYTNRGNAYAAKGDYTSALADFSKAIETIPSYTLGYYNRALTYYEAGNYIDAVNDYNKIIEAHPEYPDAYNNRGRVFLATSDYSKASADYTKAIELKSEFAEAYLGRATAFDAQGEYGKEIADYDKAIQVLPDAEAGEAHFGRAEAYAKLGDTQKALEDFRIAARSIPEGNPHRDDALKQISNIEDALAADRAKAVAQAAPATAAPIPARRYALVIGNSAYQSVSSLKNPRNDADLIAKTLRSVGFQVTELVDADYNAMRRGIIDFGRALRSGSDASLFYYSGHGIQVGGHNYLVPVDATLKGEQEAAVETFDVESYLGVMQDSGSRINIVVLDACRNNPFATVFRAAGRGLSMVRAPSGTFIGYSTAPGDVADDGDGANSPFTSALVDAITQPGVEIEEVFKKVRRKVMEETKGTQVPWDSSSITEDFYFVPPAVQTR